MNITRKISVKTVEENIIFNVTEIKKIEKENCDISIIIRTKNEELKIKECLDKLLEQKKVENFEIIVIDSGSNDKTLDIAKEYDISIYNIPSEEFNFGTSIGLGKELSNNNSKYCVFLSAHAIPVNDYWLSNMINKFDGFVAAVYSKQTYYDDTFFIERRALKDTFGDELKVQEKSSNMNDYIKYKSNITFSNASSCIRKDLIDKYPFRNIIASEDKEWAYRVLKDGYKIIYAPDSIVYHCHNESLEKYYKRIYINSKALYEFSGFEINILHVLPIMFYNIFKDIKFMKKNKIKITIENIKNSIMYRYKYAIAHYRATREKEGK